MASRSAWLKTGSRPFLRRLSASAETPTTSRSPRAAARSMTRRCPTWKTSKVPKVRTVPGHGGPFVARRRAMYAEDPAGEHQTSRRWPRRRPEADEARRAACAGCGRSPSRSCCSWPRSSTSLTRGQRRAGWGFVNAGAEASMVGAIADWFAVTALFKHPLGLPIPHTALIPERKDDLGRGLEEFVGENFLQEDVIRERIGAAGIARRVGAWLGEPENARAGRRRGRRGGGDRAAPGCATSTSRRWSREALVPRFHEEPISPLLGGLLAEALRDDLHHGLVDLALDELHGWLVEQPRDRHRGARRAGALVDAAAAQRARSPAASTSSWSAGSTTSATDPLHRARQALDDAAGRARRRPARGPRHPGSAPSGSRTACSTTRPSCDSAVSLWNALRTRAHRVPAGPRGRRAGAPAARGRARSPRAWRSDEELRPRLDGLAADARGLRRRALRRRAHRASSPAPSSAGTARRPRAGSSCTSAATCSSSGSTAPSSAAWSGLVIHALGVLLP